MNIHANSAAAFASLALGDRQREVLGVFADGECLTDRAVSERIGRELYQTRPRCTELVDAGLLREVGTRKDAVTGRNVRVLARR